jgi:hypothetical protein
MSNRIPSPPVPLSEDQVFFRDQMYQLLGWGFALILLEATIILNQDVHFNILGKPPSGQTDPLPLAKAAVVMRETKITIFFILFFTIGWAWRALSVRCRLPSHPTIPDWRETAIGILAVSAIQLFIIHEISGVSWAQLVPAFFAPTPAG